MSHMKWTDKRHYVKHFAHIVPNNEATSASMTHSFHIQVRNDTVHHRFSAIRPYTTSKPTAKWCLMIYMCR